MSSPWSFSYLGLCALLSLSPQREACRLSAFKQKQRFQRSFMWSLKMCRTTDALQVEKVLGCLIIWRRRKKPDLKALQWNVSFFSVQTLPGEVESVQAAASNQCINKQCVWKLMSDFHPVCHNHRYYLSFQKRGCRGNWSSFLCFLITPRSVFHLQSVAR